MSIENPFGKEIENNSSIVPEGVNEEYFWDVVKIVSGTQPNPVNFYKRGSHADLGSFDRSRMKSGSYEPYIETAIAQAKEIVLDPKSHLSEEVLENWKNTSFTRKRDLLAEAYNLEFHPDQTHANLGDKNGDKERTQLD